jgi:DNA ligase D-like protein (predicted 3'-phosphoesterase)
MPPKAAKQKPGQPKGKRGRGQQPWFVVQQNDAMAMHCDLGLQVDGVLKCWAVPNGPSADPADERLAMPTEDHPLDYAGGAGVIPVGEHRAGPVIVWDTGTYRNETEDSSGEKVDMAAAIGHGHVKFRLNGQKLRGGYSLTRMGSGTQERWLLVKLNHEAARNGRGNNG